VTVGDGVRAAHELAQVAAQAADSKKATDTIILDVGETLAIVEAFVVTSAANRRQVRTIADAVEEEAKVLLDRSPLRVEGLGDMQWVLLDYGDVVVHVFADEARRFYEIERLYRDSRRIAWEPAPGA
jgi:ribosome-associated protein